MEIVKLGSLTISIRSFLEQEEISPNKENVKWQNFDSLWWSPLLQVVAYSLEDLR